MPTVQVATPGARYDIHVQAGAVTRVAQLAAQAGLMPTAVAVVADQAVADTHAARAEESWKRAGVRTVRVAMPASEDEKSMATVERLCARMLDAGLDRKSAVVAVGGGIVGDTAGFAAASFMRGIACVQVPTTLLAMVDASIGGKTAVNLPRPGGALAKNMVGAIWQPRLVVCDPDVLATLDGRELRCGLAECVKAAVISDGSLLDWMCAHADALLASEAGALESLIARCAAIKAAIVSRDEREDGERALLNLGHTFGHAIEALDHTRVKHGEAVSIGVMAAVNLAEQIGVAEPGKLAAVGAALARVGLPTRLPSPLAIDALIAAMHTDKKAVGGALRLVVPYAMGDVRVVDGVQRPAIAAAWASVGAAG